MDNINRELIPQCGRCHKEIYHNDNVFKLVNDYQLIGKPSMDLFFCSGCSFYKTLSFDQLFLLFLNSTIYSLILSLISALIALCFGYNIFVKLNKEDKDIWKILILFLTSFLLFFGFLVFNKYEKFIGTHKREE